MNALPFETENLTNNILFEFNEEFQDIQIEIDSLKLKAKGYFGELVFPKKNFVYESREIIFQLPSEHLLGSKIYNSIDEKHKLRRGKEI